MLSLVALFDVSAAQSNGPSLDSYIESLRADFRADKVAIITEAMQLNDKIARFSGPFTGNTKLISCQSMISGWL
jgi:hypothetical protein